MRETDMPVPDAEREVGVTRDDRDPAATTPPIDDPEAPAIGVVDGDVVSPPEPNEPA